MAYFVALLFLIGFIANVAFGAVNGSPLLGVVAEMLILFASAIAFSVGILQSEYRAKIKRPE
ncbi:MAG: hypothetical protein OXE94_00565 [Aestuariivita sp.]|nr:hypothetical protein [Aestuariivita sp.]MCY4201661.1 hypothetical protein [Aestuariivita sp.]MCY4287928.1 hypothetical protein [Aestuariivita sp.]MCY4348193.1 hypothetical protein [Aestuariivita sp.]